MRETKNNEFIEIDQEIEEQARINIYNLILEIYDEIFVYPQGYAYLTNLDNGKRRFY